MLGIGRLPPLRLDTVTPERRSPKPAGRRSVYFPQPGKRVATDVYRGADLVSGHEFRGPAIIEETTTSVVVAPGDVCSVDALGNYLIRFEGSGVHR